MPSEPVIRQQAASYLRQRLEARGIESLVPATVWHGKGSLSRNLGRHVNLKTVHAYDPQFEHDLAYMDIEPDLIAVCKIGGHALTVLGECKARGALAVKDLGQILLYSAVSRCTASAMFFTGSASQPVKKLLVDQILCYYGYKRNRQLREKQIGFYKHNEAGSFTKVWPIIYDVLDI